MALAPVRAARLTTVPSSLAGLVPLSDRKVNIVSEFDWQFRRFERQNSVNKAELGMWVTDIQRIFRDGFQSATDWLSDGIRRKLSHSSLVGFLADQTSANTRTYGYAIYDVPRQLYKGKSLIWEDAICTVSDPCIRRQGLSKTALEKAMSHFPERDFGFVGGRTQNPVVFKRYASLGKLFPFDFGYSSEEGRDIMHFLKSHVPDTDSAEETTGICRKQYREGKLGDYRVDIEGGERFESWLEERQFDRDNGDAIIVVADLGKS